MTAYTVSIIDPTWALAWLSATVSATCWGSATDLINLLCQRHMAIALTIENQHSVLVSLEVSQFRRVTGTKLNLLACRQNDSNLSTNSRSSSSKCFLLGLFWWQWTLSWFIVVINSRWPQPENAFSFIRPKPLKWTSLAKCGDSKTTQTNALTCVS